MPRLGYSTPAIHAVALWEWLHFHWSWPSLIAVAVSVTILVFIEPYPGRLGVRLPIHVAIGISSSTRALDVVVPLTLTNSGGPRTRQDVLHIDGSIESLDTNNGPKVGITWMRGQRVAGRREFLNKQVAAKDNAFAGSFEYPARIAPFTIDGGDSVSTVVELAATDFPPGVSLRAFEIHLSIHTQGGDYRASKRYKCEPDALIVDGFTWCEATS